VSDFSERRHLTPNTRLNETNHFFNLGYGWLCKHCRAEDAERHHERVGLGRFLQKGEAEKRGAEKNAPKLPNLVLARWTDATHQSLACPRCSIEELVNKA